MSISNCMTVTIDFKKNNQILLKIAILGEYQEIIVILDQHLKQTKLRDPSFAKIT